MSQDGKTQINVCEQWEMEVNLPGEVSEMVTLYTEMGMDANDAKKIWDTYSNYPRLFLQAMLAEECKILLPTQSLKPKQMAFFRFCAFLCGMILPYLPLISFISLVILSLLINNFILLF